MVSLSHTPRSLACGGTPNHAAAAGPRPAGLDFLDRDAPCFARGHFEARLRYPHSTTAPHTNLASGRTVDLGGRGGGTPSTPVSDFPVPFPPFSSIFSSTCQRPAVGWGRGTAGWGSCSCKCQTESVPIEPCSEWGAQPDFDGLHPTGRREGKGESLSQGGAGPG